VSVRVTAAGALTHRPRMPGGIWDVPLETRMGLMAWVRSRQHQADPMFHPRQLSYRLPERVMADVRQMVGALASQAREHDIPVTAVLIPNYEQIARGVPCEMQDHLGPVLESCGVAVVDVREPFLRDADKPSLFIPDKHFSPRGNQMLLNEILLALRDRSAIASRALR
jgi:hypothetical protein